MYTVPLSACIAVAMLRISLIQLLSKGVKLVGTAEKNNVSQIHFAILWTSFYYSNSELGFAAAINWNVDKMAINYFKIPEMQKPITNNCKSISYSECMCGVI